VFKRRRGITRSTSKIRFIRRLNLNTLAVRPCVAELSYNASDLRPVYVVHVEHGHESEAHEPKNGELRHLGVPMAEVPNEQRDASCVGGCHGDNAADKHGTEHGFQYLAEATPNVTLREYDQEEPAYPGDECRLPRIQSWYGPAHDLNGDRRGSRRRESRDSESHEIRLGVVAASCDMVVDVQSILGGTARHSGSPLRGYLRVEGFCCGNYRPIGINPRVRRSRPRCRHLRTAS